MARSKHGTGKPSLHPRRKRHRSMDKLAHHGKVFTYKIQHGRRRGSKGRLQEENDICRRQGVAKIQQQPRPSAPCRNQQSRLAVSRNGSLRYGSYLEEGGR